MDQNWALVAEEVDRGLVLTCQSHPTTDEVVLDFRRMSRNTREDVVVAAGRMFASQGYDGTSMRDLGKELGLVGSSLYSHIGSKQDLLVEVVRRGSALFQTSANASEGTGRVRLRSLIAGTC